MTNETYVPPDSYASHLDAMRSPAERIFIEAREQQFRAIEQHAAAMSRDVTATLKALATEADLVSVLPCPYCAHIEALRR